VRWEETGCSLAAPIDIAAMKLVAVSQRGVRKAFHDLVALDRNGVDLDSMLEAYRRRFRVGDVTHVLRALTWFDDAEGEPPLEGTDATWTRSGGRSGTPSGASRAERELRQGRRQPVEFPAS
jgi:hypothetical protein